jgi:site-specific recombinase XerD
MNSILISQQKNVRRVSHHGQIVLSAAEFQGLAVMPPEMEWFASIESPHTRRAYQQDIQEFMNFASITTPEVFRTVNRAHILAWRKVLETKGLSGATVRRKLAALASLFEYLCDCNSIEQNPVKGVRRPKVDTYEGKTPALSDEQARKLLEAPCVDTLKVKGLRDRAILSVLLFHVLRREELTKLRIKDFNLMRSGVPHLRVQGKGNKTRYIPTHPATLSHITAYLTNVEWANDLEGALFRPIRNTRGGSTESTLTANGVYEVVCLYMNQIGLNQELLAPHALRATAATNALLHNADMAKVQEWLGHANIQTTRIYDRRSTKPEDSPTFKVHY